MYPGPSDIPAFIPSILSTQNSLLVSEKFFHYLIFKKERNISFLFH